MRPVESPAKIGNFAALGCKPAFPTVRLTLHTTQLCLYQVSQSGLGVPSHYTLAHTVRDITLHNPLLATLLCNGWGVLNSGLFLFVLLGVTGPEMLLLQLYSTFVPTA